MMRKKIDYKLQTGDLPAISIKHWPFKLYLCLDSIFHFKLNHLKIIFSITSDSFKSYIKYYESERLNYTTLDHTQECAYYCNTAAHRMPICRLLLFISQ